MCVCMYACVCSDTMIVVVIAVLGFVSFSCCAVLCFSLPDSEHRLSNVPLAPHNYHQVCRSAPSFDGSNIKKAICFADISIPGSRAAPGMVPGSRIYVYMSECICFYGSFRFRNAQFPFPK